MSPSASPVRPRDAASLVLMRRTRGTVEVLMGRRARGHAFMPHFYVFPGGRLDRADRHVVPGAPLREEVLAALSPSCPPQKARALAVAAIRETSEEAGLVVGLPRDSGAAPRPALDKLDYVGRAITPTDSPIRFHNRFFLTEGRHASGRVRGNGELLDLAWRTVAASRALALLDVTEFMLEEAERRFLGAPVHGLRRPLFGYRYQRPHITYE